MGRWALLGKSGRKRFPGSPPLSGVPGAPELRPRLRDPQHRTSSASRPASSPKLAGASRGRFPPAAVPRSHGNSRAALSYRCIESAADVCLRHGGRARNYNPQNASRAPRSRSGVSGPASWGVFVTGAIHSLNKYSLSLLRASGRLPGSGTHSGDQGDDQLPDLAIHKSAWGGLPYES